MAPKTTWGRLVTIVYALVGIPLTFLYLSNIGNFLADCFKMFYKKICCDICCCQKCDRKKKRERLKLRRRRELAAQRNTYVGPTTIMPAYNSPGLDPPLDSAGESDLLTPDDVDLTGLPGGDENLAFEDDPDEAGTRPTTPADLPKRKTPDLRDLTDANLDDMRETAILDDDYESKDDLRDTDRPVSSPGDLKVSTSMLNRLDDARETDLLEDSDEDNEMASPNGDTEQKEFNDEDGDLENLTKKEKKKRDKSMKREVSKESKRIKKEQKQKEKEEKLRLKEEKQKEKEEKRQQKQRDKEEKEAAKQKLVDDKETEKKQRKEEEKEDENFKKEEEKLARKNTTKRPSRKDTTKRRATRKEKSKGDDDTEGAVSLSPDKELNNKQEGSKKGDKLKRKDSPSKRQRSIFRRKASRKAPPDGEGLDSKAFHMSDDSFVTAQGDSMNTLNELSDGEQTGGGGTVTKQPLSSGDDDDMVIDMPGDSIEMMEYPDFTKDGGGSPINYLDQDPFDYEEEEEDEKVTVPISICLIIIAGYIFAGSVLFTLWEDWDYLTGSYFCFITLSTIGFGDIVPGTDMKEWASHEKLVLCALWLAFGLSLLAMCFNLMQEEVKEKVKWLATKIGLLKEDGNG